MDIPATGFLRCKQIVGDPTADPPVPPIVPVARSTWLQGVRDGRFPQPIKLGRRITVWRCEDIRKLVEQSEG
jgi:prophage regulatory protein